MKFCLLSFSSKPPLLFFVFKSFFLFFSSFLIVFHCLNINYCCNGGGKTTFYNFLYRFGCILSSISNQLQIICCKDFAKKTAQSFYSQVCTSRSHIMKSHYESEKVSKISGIFTENRDGGGLVKNEALCLLLRL